MNVPWYRRGPLLFAVGVLVTALVIVAVVTAITGDPRASVARDPNESSTGSTPAGIVAAADGFVAGARAAIVAVTQLDYRSLDDALTTGLGVTTGAYQRAYRAALSGTAAQQLRAGQVVQSFAPSAVGIGALSADLRTGHVLIFGVQTTTRGSGTPANEAVTLTATLVHRGDRYLISQLAIGTNPGLPSSSADLARAAETARRYVVGSLGANGATGRVTAVAIESAAVQQVVILVAGSSTADGRTADARLRVTVRRSGDGWTVAAAQSAIQ